MHKGSSESPSPAGLPASTNLRRASLTRPDSTPSVAAIESSSIPTPAITARSFQRVTSGSALTPGTRGTLMPSRKLMSSTHRATIGTKPPNDEKENILSSSRQITLQPARRAGRTLKRYVSWVSTSEIPDIEAIRNGLRRFDLDGGASGDERGKHGEGGAKKDGSVPDIVKASRYDTSLLLIPLRFHRPFVQSWTVVKQNVRIRLFIYLHTTNWWL